MYGIHDDMAFLSGLRIETVEQREYQLDLSMSGGMCLTIESAVRWRGATYHAATAKELSALLGRKIEAVEIIDEKCLRLHLDGGEAFDVFDSNDAFESFSISGPDTFIVV